VRQGINSSNRRMRTRLSGGVGGEERRLSPLSRFYRENERLRARIFLSLFNRLSLRKQAPICSSAALQPVHGRKTRSNSAGLRQNLHLTWLDKFPGLRAAWAIHPLKRRKGWPEQRRFFQCVCFALRACLYLRCW